MKLAVLSDLHANYPALDALFDDLPGTIDQAIYLGDFVGLMGFPQETTARKHADIALKGNHDVAVLEHKEGHVNSQALSEFEREHTWTALDATHRDWITELQPYAERPELGLLLAHAKPTPEEAIGIGPRNAGIKKGDFTRVAATVDTTSFDYVMVGHTHEQAVLDCSQFGHDVTVLNPGSVGQPMGEANYAVVNLADNSVDLRTVEYDVDPVTRRLKDAGVPVTWW
jgi:predicted phosphodiesterase